MLLLHLYGVLFFRLFTFVYFLMNNSIEICKTLNHSNEIGSEG